jgi:MFS family permease
MGGVFFFTSFYLQNVRGYSPLDAGLLAIPFAVGQLLSSPRSASLVSRYGARTVTAGGMVVNGLAIAGYSLLGTTTPIVLLAVLYFLQGVAMGAAMPAATSAIMDVLPRERAGAGSALTNTSRQVAVALGTAVLGSVLAQAYRSHMSPTLAHLPAAARDVAGQSINATQAVAQHLGAAGQFLLAPAGTSYVDAMRITTVIAAVVILAGAAVVVRWMPGKPKVNMDEIIAAEVAAEVAKAERELAALRGLAALPSLETQRSLGTQRDFPQLSER